VIQVSPTMRILVATEPVDLRKGIDGLAQFSREKLAADPFSGCLLIFRSRRGSTIKVLAYDGQGYWMGACPGGDSVGGRKPMNRSNCWKPMRPNY